MSNGRRIVLFTRGPRREARVKGLAAGAVRLFRRLARSWADAAERVGATFEVCCPVGREHELRAALGNRAFAVRSQTGETFNERLVASVEPALQSGEAVLVVGGDVPAPALQALERAFDHLASAPSATVIEPSPDGGVNAIGLRGSAHALFAGISWGTSRVGMELVERCRTLSAPLCVLDARLDVDDSDSARRATRDDAWRPFVSDLFSACFAAVAGLPPVVTCPGLDLARTLPARAPPAAA